MQTPDLTREALIILRDSLEPKVRRLLEHASDDDIDTLKDREVLEQGDGLEMLDLNDPIKILNVLQNLQNHRRVLFAGVADDFVLDRITVVRRLRNNWAHFGSQSGATSFNAVHWLLEKSNDPDACRKLDQLTDARRQERRAKRTSKTDAEVNRRAGQVAELEQHLKQWQANLEQERQSLEERETTVKRREDEHNSRLQLVARERNELDRRRTVLEEREKSLQRAPTADDLLRRERNVAAEEAIVAQLRHDYEGLLREVRSRANDLEAQRVAVERRSEELDDRQSEVGQMRAEADILSERLSYAIERLEELEQRQRQVVLKSDPAPPESVQTGRAREVEPSRATRATSERRPCLRTGCEGHLEEKSGKYGDFLGCTKYPDCRYTEEVSGDPSRPPAHYGSCPDCESPLVRRQSFRGPFLGCSNYPRCRHTRNLPSKEAMERQPVSRGGRS